MKQHRPLVTFLLATISMVAMFSVEACDEGLNNMVTERKYFESDKEEYLFAVGDFDNNGIEDQSYFVEKEGKYSLCVSMNGEEQGIKLRDLKEEVFFRVGIETVPPGGTYFEPCTRGIAPECRPEQITELRLNADAIVYFTYESSAALFYWNDDLFHMFWISG